MLSIQQLVRALKKLKNNTTAGGDLKKSVKHVAVCANNASETNVITPIATTLMTSFNKNYWKGEVEAETSPMTDRRLSEQERKINADSSSIDTTNANEDNSSQLLLKQQTRHCCHFSRNKCFSLTSSLSVDSLNIKCGGNVADVTTQDSVLNKTAVNTITTTSLQHHLNNLQQRSQRIHNFFQQQIFHQFHTQHNQNLNTKHKQTQFAMSSLAAEPMSIQKSGGHNANDCHGKDDDSSASDAPSSSSPASCTDTKKQNSITGQPCFNTDLADILQFMELIGNLKHTKRTGWVLRDVNDCESISGHMYRMSMLTFLLDGSEGLNQVRCMELALVHDLAESLVGDITPFCGISKEEKKNMELKAMEDICKLIEPRGKRIMELFEEYEHGESAESRFVKDLDRLDMVMQAFEYEKRDDCLLKHQEFFDSTEGKFNHPFVKKLVHKIYEQRDKLAKAKGAVLPPKIEVPNMDAPTAKTTTANGLCSKAETTDTTNEASKTS